MATVDDDGSSSPKPDGPPPPLSETVASVTHDFAEKLKTLEKDSVLPSIDYAVEQAQFARKTILDSVNDAIDITKSRLDRIRSTSSAHFNQTLDSLQDAKSDFDRYEDMAVQKIKEGICVAASHSLITAGSVFGVSLVVLKKPRRFLYYKTMRYFQKEEVLLSKADEKFKELRTTLNDLNKKAGELEKATAQAELELIKGRTKLRYQYEG
ncbi:OLC1v1038624C1 [Oldenlandia corymbosa var. corymbosa]|uniref:OLC1v1038624C1 n=1 Tax=Oldenlandia corymbosa var. corymbosa TaxID=529605 RepID=A0AAV1D077_OLDCO|nr:OLC1v1038624C1 [Oldenlandia corymbosa var. corymbosa]